MRWVTTVMHNLTIVPMRKPRLHVCPRPLKSEPRLKLGVVISTQNFTKQGPGPKGVLVNRTSKKKKILQPKQPISMV